MSNWDIGDILALLALIISIYSVIKTYFFNKKQVEFGEIANRLNSILIEKEEEEKSDQKSADISANITKISVKSGYRLKVYNKGKGTANNVRFEIIEGTDLFNPEELKKKFPMDHFEQHSSVEVRVYNPYNQYSKVKLKLLWDDDLKTGNEKVLTPTF